MMEDGLCGVDISPVAANLTAASLSNTAPDVDYSRTNIGVVRVGGPGAGTGSLEFFDSDQVADLFSARASTAGPRQDAANGDRPSLLSAPAGKADVVIMNPPYQRARGGQKQFDVAGVTETERQAVLRRARNLLRKTPANSQAGLGSAFAVLAARLAKPGGRVGLVLPMTAAAAASWASTRAHLEQCFTDIAVVWFAGGSGGGSESMSADTGMGEMLFTGTRKRTAAGCSAAADGSIEFVCLERPPGNTAAADETARAVLAALSAGRRTGTQQALIRLGGSQCGWRVRLPAGGGPWALVGATSPGPALLALRFAGTGEFVPLSATQPIAKVPMTTIGELFEVGPTHDVIGYPAGSKSPRGEFEFSPLAGRPAAAHKDTALWAANHKTQRQPLVEPTHTGLPAKGPAAAGKRNQLRARRARLFWQRNMRWTTQAVLAAVTDRQHHGGRAWTALNHPDPALREAFTVWANSTLGLAVHWTLGQRQQQGRTLSQVKAIPGVPCPDFNHQPLLKAANRLRLSGQTAQLLTSRLKPAYQADTDPARRKLDAACADLLGIPNGPAALEVLAREWCAERSIKPRRTRR